VHTKSKISKIITDGSKGYEKNIRSISTHDTNEYFQEGDTHSDPKPYFRGVLTSVEKAPP
jgi:hypothetical protein